MMRPPKLWWTFSYLISLFSHPVVAGIRLQSPMAGQVGLNDEWVLHLYISSNHKHWYLNIWTLSINVLHSQPHSAPLKGLHISSDSGSCLEAGVSECASTLWFTYPTCHKDCWLSFLCFSVCRPGSTPGAAVLRQSWASFRLKYVASLAHGDGSGRTAIEWRVCSKPPVAQLTSDCFPLFFYSFL